MRINLAFIFCLGVLIAHAQVTTTFQAWEQDGRTVEALDQEYPNAIHSDNAPGPFTGRQAAFGKTWASYYESLFQYLNLHGLQWGKPTWCFVKVYFSAEGQVDRWLFNFKKDDNIPESTQHTFSRLVDEYVKEHAFPLTAPTPFSQCSSVTFEDVTP